MITDILSQRQGWGDQTTGGAGGDIRMVKTQEELKNALIDTVPLWIVPQNDIVVQGQLRVASSKTLDARGTHVTVRGDNGGFTYVGSNIIMLNVNFDGGWADYTHDTEGADGVQARGSENLWFHHCRFAQWKDGCIDLKEGCKNVSVTWCRFEKHYQAFLWMVTGGTLAYCYGSALARRFPKSVGGRVHAYNNVIEGWLDPEIECAKDGGQLLSEYSSWTPGKIKTVGKAQGGAISSTNHFAKGVTFTNVGKIDKTFAADSRFKAKITKSETFKSAVKSGAGCTLIAGV